MGITIDEKHDSREVTGGSDPSVTLKFVIQGTDSDIVALALVKAACSTIYLCDGISLQRQNYGVTPLEGGLIWEGTVRYGKYAPLSVADSSYSFSIGSETNHITQSMATTGYVASGTAPNHSGAIGVHDGDVDGVDIDLGSYEWSETYQFNPALITLEYKLILFQLRKRVNDKPWRNFAAGEVRLMGVSGTYKTGDDYAELTYSFKANPNVTNQTIGTITGINKKGWEYLWVEYESTEDATAKKLVKKPIAVHVEKVYETGDYSLLGIGL